MNIKHLKKLIILNLPYLIIGLLATNLGEAWRNAHGLNLTEKVQSLVTGGVLAGVFNNPFPSLHPADLFVGALCGLMIRLAVYLRSKNAKKFRHNEEYGSARWGTRKDIEPYVDEKFQNNILLTQTERLTMNGRPANPKYARNKNVLVIGGSGSGKTRFYVKPSAPVRAV